MTETIKITPEHLDALLNIYEAGNKLVVLAMEEDVIHSQTPEVEEFMSVCSALDDGVWSRNKVLNLIINSGVEK